jgi:hypothetical protein
VSWRCGRKGRREERKKEGKMKIPRYPNTAKEVYKWWGGALH